MTRRWLTLAAMFAVLGACFPRYFINTRSRLAGYCGVQAFRLSQVAIGDQPESLAVFVREAKRNGVHLTQRGDVLHCTAAVYS